MEDGNFAVAKNDKTVSTSLENLYCDHPAKFTTNGHDVKSEAVGVATAQQTFEATPEDAFKKRVNPLKIHLGKRPFVDNSPQFHSSTKKKAPTVNKHPELTASPNNTVPRAPRLIPKKKINSNLFHNVTSQAHSYLAENEQDKPVPRLVPKSQLEQFKKSAAERAQASEGPQTAGLQPTVKFKCRKCYSMSFKTLAMLKEHQLVCKGQTKEPAHSPETAQSGESTSGGPSRVTKKVYLCSACGTYYENWNLFLHMREVHNRHICLFCLGMFSKAEKLAAHLTNKHNVQEHTYDTKEDFLNVYNGTLYLMCCECDEICSEQDDFFNHDCNNVKPVPVPVLVSKNSMKMNNLKQIKNHSDLNNPVSKVKETKSICDSTKDRRHLSEPKPETVTTLPSTVTSQSSECEPISSVTNVRLLSAAESNRDTSEKSNISRIESSNNKSVPSPDQQAASDSRDNKDLLPNGEDDMNYSVDSDTPEAMDTNHSADETPVKYHPCPPEKGNCGIKLKLSLNKANSPVIINSTVDPTVGLHSASKPSSRSRRPPKRYVKPTLSPYPVNALPKTPTIKMTISQSDSPYVKTTIYENNEETLLKSLLNNNLDTAASKSLVQKPDNTVLSTIYDNSLEDSLNTLNRVPKLTVKIPKELLDKDSSSEYSSDSDLSDKLTMDENNTTIEEPNKIIDETKPEIQPETQQFHDASVSQEDTNNEIVIPKQEDAQPDEIKPLDDTTTDPTETQIDVEKVPDEPVVEEIPAIELKLDKPLDKYPIKELLKLFLTTTIYNCIYCNHVRKIAVNCEQLSLHMASEHRFCATVDSITAEELLPETITAKVKADAEEVRTIYINFDSYDSEDNSANKQMIDFLFECFQCFFKTPVHKDLYLHNRKMHHKTILFCVMCKSNFYSYSELICHLCPGAYDSDYEVKFRCCFCNLDSIPSSFRLMVHLRKSHSTCDVCLELCFSQAKLSNHVWKHKLHHFCYRCGITYRNKQDITKHLFWKHGTESLLCKRCLQKKWPHVYHFCSPPAVFTCEECNLQFSRAVYLKVHKRFHLEEFPHPCIEEGCTEKFVSKKLLMKHLEEHQRKLATIDLEEKTDKNAAHANILGDAPKEPMPIIDLVDDKPAEQTTASTEVKTEAGTEQLSKKSKKKKLKDALLLDVNLPELNLSESDSSDESDSGMSQPAKDEKVEVYKEDEKPIKLEDKPDPVATVETEVKPIPDKLQENLKVEEKAEPIEEKPDEQQVLEIWDNFKKYQAKTEKQKTPPLVPIKKHVCESDHDYCLIPTDMNGDDDPFNLNKKKNKKKDKKRGEFSSSSSSSSSDSDSSCSCGSNCSCSSSSGSSSSSSSDSDSSDEQNRIKKKKQRVKTLSHRRMSNGSNVDVMGMSETPILIPEKTEPPIPETDLETNESETDEEFYDKHPQRLANQLFAEKRNQLMLLASVAPSDGGSMSGEASRPATPPKLPDKKEKMSSSKKKSKKKKRSKSSRKHEPIKINIPKDLISTTVPETPLPPIPNKITISLQSNTVQMPQIQEYPITPVSAIPQTSTQASSDASKRASKRRRVPNKFYGYSSDEEGGSSVMTHQHLPLKPQLPPKLEWRKEDLPSPVTHRPKKEVPTSTATPKIYNYPEPIRLKAPPRPEPEPPKNLMNTESMDSSDSDSSDDGALEIYQPSTYSTPTLPPPTYLNSGTSSLPYAFQRPAGRQAREGESVYCYCRCPYDEVSEMIACDADGCAIEWFHFECVGIMVPPKGKWYCPECRKKACFSGYRS